MKYPVKWTNIILYLCWRKVDAKDILFLAFHRRCIAPRRDRMVAPMRYVVFMVCRRTLRDALSSLFNMTNVSFTIGFRLSNEKAMISVDRWRQVRHPGIVSLHEAFTTSSFGDHCKENDASPSVLAASYPFLPLALVFVYDFHPMSTTLKAKHFSNPTGSIVPEFVLWGYITQLVSAIRAIHMAGLACRSITPSKVLLTSKNR